MADFKSNKTSNVPNLRFSFTGQWNNQKLDNYISESKIFTSDFIKYPLYSFTIEEGVVPKTERYERGFLVKKEGDTFKIIKPGQFLMNPMNLRFGAINFSKIDCIVSVSGYYDIFNIDNNSSPYFWLGLLSNRKAIRYYNSIATGSLSEKKRVHFSQLRNSLFYIPDDKERKKISSLLEDLDSRISVQNKIINELITYRNGLIGGFFSNCNQSISLKAVLEERKTYSEKGLSYEHVTLSKEGIIPKSERYDRDFLVKDDSKEYKITKLNDICYNPANLKFGVICLNDYGDAIFSPIYVTFEVRKDFDPFYVSLYLTSSNFINYILKYQQGTVYERMAVSPEDLVKGNLPFSKNNESFSKLIKTINSKIKTETKLLEKYKNQKVCLLNNLFI